MQKTVISFSGGKDSTALLLMMIERGERIDDVVFFDTGWEFPEMYDHLEQVEKYTGRKITRVKPPEDFTFMLTEHRRVIRRGKYKGEAMIGYGFPGFGTRWCTGRKQRTLNEYFRQYEEHGVMNCIGYAADEKHRIQKVHPNAWQKFRFPLVEAGMTENQEIRFSNDRGFEWGGAYKRNRRLSCWCCPLQNLNALRNLFLYYPQLWQKLREWQITLRENCHAQKNRHGYIDFKDGKTVEQFEQRFRAELQQGKLF